MQGDAKSGAGAGVLLELDLSSVNLTCTLPTALLSQLTSLQSLKLANNPSLRVSSLQKISIIPIMSRRCELESQLQDPFDAYN